MQIQASAAVQGSASMGGRGTFQILEVSAALAGDPQTAGALLVYVAVSAIATLPLGLAYRVTVVSRPDALV